MKKIILVLFMCFIVSLESQAKDYKTEEVKIDKYGMAIAQYGSFRGVAWLYMADTVTEICYIVSVDSTSAKGPEVISCEKLAKRKEWSSIINWIK